MYIKKHRYINLIYFKLCEVLLKDLNNIKLLKFRKNKKRKLISLLSIYNLKYIRERL